MDKKEGRSKNIKLLAISLAFSSIVILIVLYLTVDKNTITYLTRVKIEFFILALVLQFCAWFLWSLRIYIMTKTVDPNSNLSIPGSMCIVIANLFLAGITPSMAGGEPVRIHLLSKKGLDTGCATAVVLSERIFDAIFILMMIPFALIIFQHIISIEIIRFGLTVGIILFITGIGLFFYAAMRPEKIKWFFNKLRKKSNGKKDGLLAKIEGLVNGFHRGVVLIFKRKNTKNIILIFFITVVSWFVGFLIPSCILLSLDHNPIWIQSIAAQILLLVIILIPTTPGSSGVAEGAASLLYGGLVNISILGVLIVLWRLVTFHISIIMGGIFQYKVFKSIKKKVK